MSDLKSMQRNHLERINKEELIDMILASNNENSNLLEITKKLNEVINEMESLKSLVTSPDRCVGGHV